MSFKSRHSLPTFDGRIDVKWIEFDAVASAVGALSCEKGCSTAQERVQNDVVTSGRIKDRIAHHQYRFDGWMEAVARTSPGE
jgi:hypothetical protein